MPIFQEIKEDKYHILIWKYEEGESLEVEDLLDEEEKAKIQQSHYKRQREFLLVRKMLKTILPNHKIKYQDNGEPYLEPKDRFISISHSFPFVAIAISDEKIGIDLEKKQEKLVKIKSKFLHSSEYSWAENDDELLTIIWSIKEALYKIHQKKYWSFREHYEVLSFDLSEKKSIKCRVFDKENSEDFSANLRKVEDYYLVIVK